MVISIIVPVYNVEAYLRRCLNSILAQTFSHFEIILVDDGSKDNSGKICDEYAARDSRIHVIHKENGGVSTARNIGLNAARGKYIAFVDGDDWLAPNMYEVMIETAETSNAEIVLCGYTAIFPNYQVTIRVMDETIRISDLLANTERKYANIVYLSSICTKLFLRNIIVEHSLRFDTTVFLGEDFIFNMNYLACIERMTCLNRLLYYYDNTIVTSATKKYYKDFVKYVKKMSESICNAIANHGIAEADPEQFVMRFESKKIIACIRELVCSTKSEVEQLNILNEWIIEISRNTLEYFVHCIPEFSAFANAIIERLDIKIAYDKIPRKHIVIKMKWLQCKIVLYWKIRKCLSLNK